MKKPVPVTSNRLPDKLREIRVALELSQSELLARLGFSDVLFRSNVSQYERGLRVPAPAVLLAYARLINVDLAVLIDDDLDLPDALPSPTKSEGVPHRRNPRKSS